MVHFDEFLENLKLAFNQCYQTGQFKKDKNWWKMPKKIECDTLSNFQTMCPRLLQSMEMMLNRELESIMEMHF